jgi:hypothetical protein
MSGRGGSEGVEEAWQGKEGKGRDSVSKVMGKEHRPVYVPSVIMGS